MTFTYDALGRVKAYTDGRLNKTITYEYDKNGNKTKMTDPEGGITSYVYNALNLIKTITNPTGKIFDFTYDELGRRSGLTYPNGINATYTYDPASNLTGIVSITPELATVNTNTYTYDNIGNRLTNTDTIGVRTYTYDAPYQLTETTHLLLTPVF